MMHFSVIYTEKTKEVLPYIPLWVSFVYNIIAHIPQVL